MGSGRGGDLRCGAARRGLAPRPTDLHSDARMPSPVSHSVDADGIGWITFDNPAGRANVFNPDTLAALRAAVTALAAQPVKAVVVVSAKEKIFVAGADVKWLGALADAQAAEQAALDGQAVFGLLADFKAPVVCAIHGACAGGGFEMALACQWRIATEAPETVIGLPEVGLGVIPGWGGCARLPRLIGVKAAVGHILKARLVPATEAVLGGLVDELVPADALKVRAKEAALKLAAAPASRPAPPLVTSAFFAEQRRALTTKMRGLPAPAAALEAVEQGMAGPVAAALAIEARKFGAVAAGDVAKNLIHLFSLKDAAKKATVDAWFPSTPAGATPPPTPRFIGIVGAGVMGSGIAQWCAARGIGVMVSDTDGDALKRGVQVIRELFGEAVKRGKMTGAAAHKSVGSIGITTDLLDFADCDMVIEAVVEDAGVKRKLLGQLSGIVAPECVLASNTSALPIEELAATAKNPQRVVGLHFFNPVSRMPLVEVVLGRQTSRAAAEQALAFTRLLGKTAVICRSAPGFFVTRVLFFHLNAACRLWEEGVPAEALDAAMREWGWPMGPLRLIDEVGVDVTDCINGEMKHFFPGRFTGAEICRKLLAAGFRGRKHGTSSGFYEYGGLAETLNPALARFAPAATKTMTAQAIQEQLNGVMIEETKRVLAEGVLKSADDADLALLLGAGFPAWRGGLMRFAKKAGLFAG